MKKHISTIVAVVILLAGLSLLLYPTISNYWNTYHQTKAIANYTEQVDTLKKDECERLWAEAEQYNENIANRRSHFMPTKEEQQAYPKMLDLNGDGIMGYIEIDSIDVSLPIYHGTTDAILSVAVGHFDWASLPVGGIGTHCVVSGHRGLPSATLFTNLDELSVGDTFVLHVLNESLTYEVDRITTVKPDDVSSLELVDGKDYCTLVTCTPYGINTHRLLVRGHRVPNEQVHKAKNVTATAVRIKPLLVAMVIGSPLFLILIIVLIQNDKKRRREKELQKEFEG